MSPSGSDSGSESLSRLPVLKVSDTNELAPKIARIEKYLKDDPYYERFVRWSTHAKPFPSEERGMTKALKDEVAKNQRAQERELQIDYLYNFARFINPYSGIHPDSKLQSARMRVLEEHVRGRRMSEGNRITGYLNFQRTLREAQGHHYRDEDEVNRVQGDQRSQISEWIERLTLYDHYDPAFQYLMLNGIMGLTSVRNGTPESPRFGIFDRNSGMPPPPFYEVPVGILHELFKAYDSKERNKEIARVYKDNQSFLVGVTDMFVFHYEMSQFIKNGDVNSAYAALAALVTDYQEMEGEITGRWIEITNDGCTDELTKRQEKEWGLQNLSQKKKGIGADILQRLSKHSPWWLRFIETARSYLERGKLLVFIENVPKDKRNPDGFRPAFGVAFNSDGVPYEARGGSDSQELNPRMAPEVKRRMEGVGGWDTFKKQMDDTLLLASAQRFLERPNLQHTPENHDEYVRALKTIYEIDRNLSGFGYGGMNTHVQKIRKKRESVKMQDAEIIFGKVATAPGEITQDTSVYVGSPLLKEAWEKIHAIEDERMSQGNSDRISVFSSFPNRKIARREHVLKATTRDEENEMGNNLRISGVVLVGSAASMLGKIPDEDLNEAGTIETVTLSVKELFTADELALYKSMHRLPTTEEIFDDEERLKKLGIEVCSARDAAHMLLDDAKAPESKRTFRNNQSTAVSMKRIPDRLDKPGIFSFRRGNGSLELQGTLAVPGDGWILDTPLVFRLRKS